MTKPGHDYETAVFEFAKTLDQKAEVLFDHHVPDRDTGTSRQCDVWINANFGGHWPISILVSCKDHERRINIGHITTFIGEVQSTRANMGVIYSSGGFSAPALLKAKTNGIACCKLYDKDPADLPELIWFESFTCRPNIFLSLKTDINPSNIETWGELFNLVAKDDETGEESKVLDILSKVYLESEKKGLAKTRKTGGFPANWTNQITIHDVDGVDELQININCIWRKYHARQEAHLLHGSYSFSNESFSGKVYGPAVDTQSDHPGKDWIEITDRDFVMPINKSIIILYEGDIENALLNSLGNEALP